MSARPAKHLAVVVNQVIPAGQVILVKLGTGVTEYSLRVVDAATGIPIDYTLAHRGNPNGLRHFVAADPPYVERDIGPLRAELELLIGLGAAPLVAASIAADTEYVNATTGAAAIITASIPGVAGKVSYLSGFTVDGLGATAGSVIEVTVGPTFANQTMRFELTIPAGVGVAITPLRVEFVRPVPSQVGIGITVTVPSFGAGNTSANVSAHGFSRGSVVGTALNGIAELTAWRRAPVAAKRKVNPLEAVDA